jgi:hypothetical protein
MEPPSFERLSPAEAVAAAMRRIRAARSITPVCKAEREKMKREKMRERR